MCTKGDKGAIHDKRCAFGTLSYITPKSMSYEIHYETHTVTVLGSFHNLRMATRTENELECVIFFVDQKVDR